MKTRKTPIPSVLKSVLLLSIILPFIGMIHHAEAQVPSLIPEGKVCFPGTALSNGDTTGTSDIWGWIATDGEEYILVGVLEGLAIIRASDMEHLLTVNGPMGGNSPTTRDIKTYRNYAYVVGGITGVNAGIQIFDLSGLPDTAIFIKNLTDQLTYSHNLSIDTARAKGYFVSGRNQAVIVYDLVDPENPVAIASLPSTFPHDVFARNDTLWATDASEYNIWNVADPTNPQLIARVDSPFVSFTHNIWPSGDGSIFVTTEEMRDFTVKIWSLGSNGHVRLLSEFLGSNRLAHNAYVKGNTLYISHYTSGVYVVDISNPRSPLPLAKYDMYPLNDSASFHGCWGVYPYGPSNNFYTSSIEGKVHKFSFINTTSMEDEVAPPSVFLHSNPSASPTLRFHLKEAQKVELRWFSAEGRMVGSQTSNLGPGNHQIQTNSQHWPVGIYVYQFITRGGKVEGKWMKN